MNDSEYQRIVNVVTRHLSPCPCSREDWVISGAEDAYEEMRTAAAMTAATAMARASIAAPALAPISVTLPAELGQAIREVSCAPAAHALLALLEADVSPAFADAIVSELDDLQMEQDVKSGQRPWGWRHWDVSASSLTWTTCSGATEITLTATGATLTRRAGGGEVITGEWVWEGEVLTEAWVDIDDPRAEHLTGILGGLVGVSPELAQEGEERELEAVEREARERGACEQARYERFLRPQRRHGARGHKARDKGRRAARAHKARATWDKPVA